MLVGGQSLFKAVNRVNDWVQLPLLESAEHLLKGGPRPDGDAAQRELLYHKGKERDLRGNTIEKADHRDMAADLRRLQGASQVLSAGHLHNEISSLA